MLAAFLRALADTCVCGTKIKKNSWMVAGPHCCVADLAYQGILQV